MRRRNRATRKDKNTKRAPQDEAVRLLKGIYSDYLENMTKGNGHVDGVGTRLHSIENLLMKNDKDWLIRNLSDFRQKVGVRSETRTEAVQTVQGEEPQG